MNPQDRQTVIEARMCMPFDVFHESVTKALGRPVYTHEFGLNRQGLIEELAGRAGHPSIDEIMALLPQDKLLAIDLAAPGGT